MNTEERVKEVIEDIVGIRPNLTDTLDSLDLDDFDKVEIIVELEGVFAINIPDDKAENFESVEDIVNYINEKVS